MNTVALRKLGLAIALLGMAAAASAAEGKDVIPAETAGAAVAQPVQSNARNTPSMQEKSGLTREQVMEDLKQYQRQHANPSYSELVFLR
ncbi:hypothetical protein [Herbaspirillum sp.]|uniref:hypothetical protein n=1 Tax=Herbaspirillum sp. TaxID=1890675 RepID=UPI001B0F8F5D|nr:hypothetical protein [Herbaspirillum sp.]MBO9536621.1 hypothetical protein [Herbaspirillum sp.]